MRPAIIQKDVQLLQWKDIDFDEGLVHIRRTSNYVAGEGMYTDTTKTKKSQCGDKVSACNVITNALDFSKNKSAV